MITRYQKQWDLLEGKFEAGKLGHAYLLSGRDLELISLFAKDFVKLINNNSYDTAIDNNIFPDLRILRSQDSASSVKNEKDMMAIEIEQIRELQNFLALKSFYGSFSARGGSAFGGKAVIIENAERMTLEAQNCFLKNLEEPKGKTIIFLISSRSEMLLPTIFSRCEELKFLGSKNETFELPKELFNIIHLDLAEKFKYTKNVNLEGDNFNRILNCLQRYFRNLLLIKIGVVKGEENNYSTIKLKKIIRLIENVSYQSNSANINNKLALEIILMEI